MGFSGRYHAASLAAVFIALAIGILIGIGLADDVISTASQELEDTLRSNLEQAEDRVSDQQVDLDRERDYSAATYPALVDGRLGDSTVALVGMGSLSRDTATAVTEALEPAGARIGAVAVIGGPLDLEALAEAARPRYADLADDEEQLRRFGEAIGSQLAGGGTLVRSVRDQLFSRLDGNFNEVDSIVFVASAPGEDAEALTDEDGTTFTEALLPAAETSAGGVVAVKRIDIGDGSLERYREAEIGTVDDVDIVAGQVSMVFVLAGADGDFGVGGDSDGLVPELPRARPAR